MVVRGQLVTAPVWDEERLEADLKKAIEIFREERMREPLEAYLDQFEEYQDAFDQLLEETVDLSRLSERAIEMLGDPRLQEAVRYLAGPPMSLDDLKTLASASLSLKRLKADPAMAQRIIETVLLGLDRRRFPWASDKREATEAERRAAVLASAALIASQKVPPRGATRGRRRRRNGPRKRCANRTSPRCRCGTSTRSIRRRSSASSAARATLAVGKRTSWSGCGTAA